MTNSLKDVAKTTRALGKRNRTEGNPLEAIAAAVGLDASGKLDKRTKAGRDAAVGAAMKERNTLKRAARTLHWRWHYEGDSVRVWLDEWQGDLFEIFPLAEWEILKLQLTTRFGFKVIAHGDED